jgi:nucleotide-binding universal stress UspA family protein
MYEKVLAAVDHSEVSERVLAAARDLALLSKGQVWVIHLREREVIPRMGQVPAESESDAEAEVTAAVDELTAAGVTAHGVIRDTVFGSAAREIIDDAREHQADVIVMGSRGRGDLAGLVLGSTAHKVIHLADQPVLVVR